MENWAVPSSNATSLKLKGDLVYFVLSKGEVKSAILKNILLDKIKTIEWQGKRIPINYSGYSQINGGYLISHKIYSIDLGVAVEKVVLDLNEEFAIKAYK